MYVTVEFPLRLDESYSSDKTLSSKQKIKWCERATTKKKERKIKERQWPSQKSPEGVRETR